FHIKYKNVRITSAQTRWGSCSGHGNLYFSWRLIMAPLEVIDYVVIHELAHIHMKNHSPKFWEKVESMYPDYVACKKWLRDNQTRLPL
ncbi:MAG: M48 family metallopeptidase, partial [Chloroflexi bacterium]|nr:M48 family metallopeptidase [Chloroflexota bacterium]